MELWAIAMNYEVIHWLARICTAKMLFVIAVWVLFYHDRGWCQFMSLKAINLGWDVIVISSCGGSMRHLKRHYRRGQFSSSTICRLWYCPRPQQYEKSSIAKAQYLWIRYFPIACWLSRVSEDPNSCFYEDDHLPHCNVTVCIRNQ